VLDAETYRLLGVRWYGNGCHEHSVHQGRELKTKQLNLVQANDVVYNKMWTTTAAFAVAEQAHHGLVATSEYPTFVADLERLFPPYLRAFMTTEFFLLQARDACQGSTSRARLNPSAFLDLSVRLPPLPEQKKIAAILSSVDETIAKTESVIAQLQIVKKAMMEQLLTKGMPGRHTRFKQTEIGEIPEEWEVGTIGSYCQVDNHLRTPIRLDERERNPGPYPYYGPTKVLNHIGTFKVEGRYVLIGEDGDHFLKYATWAMTQLVDGRFNVNNHAHLIRGVRTCSTEWVYQYFKHRDLTSVLTRQGANRYKLTKAGLTDLRFPVPRLSEQQEIHSAIESIERRISSESLTKEAHLSLKSALSSSLLSGEIRVAAGGA